MANKGCISRLQKEYRGLLKDPVPNIQAHPSPTNLLEWHFALEGQKGTEYEGGVYHGKIVFPTDYPFKPPSLQMTTPNGRFQVNTKLCLSMTDYHPESWNPMWSVGTMLTGLLSFMCDNHATTGSIVSSGAEKRKFAKESLAHNMKNATFKKLFPKWVELYEQTQQAIEESQKQKNSQVQNSSQSTYQPRQKSEAGFSSFLSTMAVVVLVVALMAIPLFTMNEEQKEPDMKQFSH